MPRITVIRTGRRHLLGKAGRQYQIWRTGLFKRRVQASFDDTESGYADAQTRFSEIEPNAVSEPHPGTVSNLGRFTGLTTASVVAAVVIVLGTAGIFAIAGTDSSNPASAEHSLINWVGTDSNVAVMLQWTRNGNTVTGSLIASDLVSGGSTSLQSVDQAFTGVINGEGATLTFPGWFGATMNLAAQLHGSNLTLSFPESTGGVHEMVLASGNVTDYNNDVAELQRKVRANTQASAAASAVAATQAAAAQQSADAEKRRLQDTQSFQDNLANLSQDTNLSNDSTTLTNDVKQADADLGMTRQDASSGGGDNCVNASSTVYNDAASTVYNDAVSSFANDVNSLTQDIATVKSEIAALQSAATQMTSDGLMPPASGNDAVRTAQNGISQALTAANADTDKINTDVANAYAVANSIATGPCAGMGPGNPPTPLAHIG